MLPLMKHSVKQNPAAPGIKLSAGFSSLEDFWRSDKVIKSCYFGNRSAWISYWFRQPKIVNNSSFIRTKKNISSMQVKMIDIILVKIWDTSHYLNEIVPSFSLIHVKIMDWESIFKRLFTFFQLYANFFVFVFEDS